MRGAVTTSKEGRNCQGPYLGALAQTYVNALVFFLFFKCLYSYSVLAVLEIECEKRKKKIRGIKRHIKQGIETRCQCLNLELNWLRNADFSLGLSRGEEEQEALANCQGQGRGIWV